MKCFILFAGVLLMVSCFTQAADVSGFTTTANERFSSGFPLSPVQNTDPAFVGDGYDWSAIAWSTETYTSFNRYKGFGVLSPKHFLTAQHYEYDSLNETTSGIRVLDQTSTVQTRTVSSITNTGYGLVLENPPNSGNINPDVAVGTLSSPLEAAGRVSRMGVLDLYPSSTSGVNNTELSVYTGLPVFLNGRSHTSTDGSPVVASTSIDLTAFNGAANQPYIRTTHDDVELEVGDSGHAALHGWTNPNGEQELTVLGMNSTSDSKNGFNNISMLAQKDVMAATSGIMASDGFALRIVGPTEGSWDGGSGGPSNSDKLTFGGNWTGSFSDQHVLFDAATASVTAIEVDAATNLRGLYFKESGAGSDGFSFGGAGALTLGRGGLTNYDADRQVFTAALSLGAHQYWDVGSGGVTAGDIETNGNLLEIGGAGSAILNGEVSGSGGLALSGESLEVTGASSYTGGTWVHSGVMNVSGDLSSSSGVEVGAYGTLAGTGVVAGLSGAGSVAPGNSPGILTTSSVDPSGGLDFHFEFTAVGGPDYTDASASVQDVLRITGGTPFTSGLDAANAVNVYLNVGGLSENDVFQGGFFTDTEGDFLTEIENADFQWFLADAAGNVEYNGVNYSAYEGPFSLAVSTIGATGDFQEETVNGQVMQFVVVPELSSLALAGILLGVVAVWRRQS